MAGLIIARRLRVIEFLCENEIISIQRNVITSNKLYPSKNTLNTKKEKHLPLYPMC